jgi:hypothetical protein
MAGDGEAEDRMTDEERERRYTRFFGEGMATLWAILDSPGGAQFWGKRLEGYGLGVLQQAMEEASRRKGKEPTKESPPRETERHKIQREEEQGNEEEADIDNRITKSKERFYKEKEGLLRLHRALQVVGGPRVEGYDLDLIDLRREYQPPEPESEKIQEEEKQGSSPPPPSEQANTRWFPSSWGSWVTFPREQDNPANWITNEYGEWRSRYDCTVAPYHRTTDPEVH